MSYKALLFCPDEKTARAVTQVLSELDFAVERSGEPFATVKKLADLHFDALVVDCQNEQDAALLFKGARNSTFNHSALSVAVVEGQAGVAKAFRIGANLVLTKPINIEQSKGTLRVARGLLKKAEARTATVPTSGVAGEPILFAPKPVSAPAATANSSSFSVLELDREDVPATEAAEAAVLESLPDPVKPAAPASQTWAPSMKNSAEPIAASTTGVSGAAAAPALAKVPLEIKTAPPMATHEPIMESEFSEPTEAASVPVPSFASYSQDFPKSGSKKVFVIAAVVLLAAGLAFVGIKMPQLFQNLHHQAPAEAAKAPAPAAVETPEATVPSETENIKSAEPEPLATNNIDLAAGTPLPPAPKPQRAPNIEIIHVDQAETTPDPKITVEPKPLVVNTKRSTPTTPANTQGAPQPPTLSAENTSDNPLANLVSTNTTLPKAAPGSLRVSQGVSQGLLVKRVSPVYPPIALQLKKQGAVELLARISKEGDISAVQVLSGDAMLARSAATAVKQWKYRPYLLNGMPVEIETQITVNFTLPH